MSGDGQTQKSLRSFAEAFEKGLDELSAGDLAAAETDIHLSRDMWPEFFGPDFILALIYERTGNIDAAARYYKSYLIKLKFFEEGRYRISDPVIRSILPGPPDRYDEAFALISLRLEKEGISINAVRPAQAAVPVILYILMAALGALLFYFSTFKWFLPFLRKRHRLAHPPEGFWICERCLAENPDPSMVCQECGRPRKAQPNM